MSSSSLPDDAVTELLHRWANGDAPAGARLFSLVYDELRVVARRQRQRWRNDDTLGTTALVHEVYLRLNGAAGLPLADRAHFFAVASRATRQILSNYARRGRAAKRGEGTGVISIERADAMNAPHHDPHDTVLDRLWDLETALQRLHELHPRPCRVVECRYFGGLSIPETALALDISEATVKRDWMLAQSWLYRVLRHHAPDHD
jgi:RNA polymerase sigma factor (TIGR02999 family)